MNDRLTSAPQRSANRYSGGINRVESPWRAQSVPYITIVLGSILPVIILADAMPLVPPLGFVMLLGWRIMRPGLLPMWIGVPLGAVDDMLSGQPFGSAILLWSITMIIIEIIETRFPWRGFWQDWFTAGLAIISYIVISMLVSGATLTPQLIFATLPQLILTVLLYPLFSRMIAWFDLFRLRRARRIW